MPRHVRPLFVLLGLLALGSCRDSNAPDNTVQVLDNHFDPDVLTVPAGTIVYWVWNGVEPHDIVFEAGEPNAPAAEDGQFERLFDTPGTYDYECTFHGGMTGRIIVQ